jgi:predicted nucleic acid-binding protein
VILADTSTWVRHFRGQTAELAALLRDGRIVMHPWVRLEVALGTPPRRRQTLMLMARLEALPVATDDELDAFVEARSLHSRGVGLVDVALLAAVMLRPGTRLWTFERNLEAVARTFGCAYETASSRPPSSFETRR